MWYIHIKIISIKNKIKNLVFGETAHFAMFVVHHLLSNGRWAASHVSCLSSMHLVQILCRWQYRAVNLHRKSLRRYAFTWLTTTVSKGTNIVLYYYIYGHEWYETGYSNSLAQNIKVLNPVHYQMYCSVCHKTHKALVYQDPK